MTSREDAQLMNGHDSAVCCRLAHMEYQCAPLTLRNVPSFTWAQWLLWLICQIIVHSFRESGASWNGWEFSLLSGRDKRSPGVKPARRKWPGAKYIYAVHLSRSRHSPFGPALPAQRGQQTGLKSALWVCERGREVRESIDWEWCNSMFVAWQVATDSVWISKTRRIKENLSV